jgi:uncharacterized protein (DUF427 family)
VRTHPSERWVRCRVGDVDVVDTRDPLLFWEEGFPPSYAFDPADVRTDLLHPGDPPGPEAPFFFLPKGPVRAWFDLRVGDHVVPQAAWVRDDPALDGRLVLSWRPGALRWQEEDEEVRGHPRDPFKRVDALVGSRHVVVARDGVLLADSRRPVVVFETDLPVRWYLPREDVRLDLLVPGAGSSHCPYKGTAREYWDLPASDGRPGVTGVAWSYADPFPAVDAIAGRVAFYDELVDVSVDGVRRPRPASVFSEERNRPTTA